MIPSLGAAKTTFLTTLALQGIAGQTTNPAGSGSRSLLSNVTSGPVSGPMVNRTCEQAVNATLRGCDALLQVCITQAKNSSSVFEWYTAENVCRMSADHLACLTRAEREAVRCSGNFHDYFPENRTYCKNDTIPEECEPACMTTEHFCDMRDEECDFIGDVYDRLTWCPVYSEACVEASETLQSCMSIHAPAPGQEPTGKSGKVWPIVAGVVAAVVGLAGAAVYIARRPSQGDNSTVATVADDSLWGFELPNIGGTDKV